MCILCVCILFLSLFLCLCFMYFLSLFLCLYFMCVYSFPFTLSVSVFSLFLCLTLVNTMQSFFNRMQSLFFKQTLCCCYCAHSVVSDSFKTLWTDFSPPGSSFHGILQAKILEWVAISSSRESSQPRDRTHVSCTSCISQWVLYHCTTWEARFLMYPKDI